MTTSPFDPIPILGPSCHLIDFPNILLVLVGGKILAFYPETISLKIEFCFTCIPNKPCKGFLVTLGNSKSFHCTLEEASAPLEVIG